MTSITKGAEILSEVVVKIFGDFISKGCQITAASIKRTDAIGEYVEVLVLNPVTGKSLLFMYSPAKDMRPEGIAIILQNSSGDSFSIDEFLMHKKINFRMDDSLNLTKYDGSLEIKLEKLLKASKEIILKYLDSYLFGNEWENIPIHWGDMK